MAQETYAYRAVTPQELELAAAPSNLNSIKELAEAIPDFNSIPHNIVPSVDNQYTLGTSQKRWQSISIGGGTIYITDTVTGDQVGITVSNGIFFLDGIAQAQLPHIKVTDLTFGDNTVQTTAYLPEAHYTHLSFIASAPLHDHGQAGHKKYDAFLDSSYLYICNSNYVNDNTKIWYRIASNSSGNW
jgi:hypothetical protein